MGDIVSDGTKFICPVCTGQPSLQVKKKSTTGDSKLLANETDTNMQGSGQCLAIPSSPKPCNPSVSLIDAGQSPVKIDGAKALGSGCMFACSAGPGAILTVASNSQTKVKHNGASGAATAVAIKGSVIESMNKKEKA